LQPLLQICQISKKNSAPYFPDPKYFFSAPRCFATETLVILTVTSVTNNKTGFRKPLLPDGRFSGQITQNRPEKNIFSRIKLVAVRPPIAPIFLKSG
jgi:hypothetical protein